MILPSSPTLTRREALRRILAASALAATLDITAFAADDVRGIGFDPDMLKKEIPWPRILTVAEKRIVTALGDIIIPADEHGPAASAVGVPDFIDEWVSAPYDTQQRDLGIIRKGLAWIDGEARKRFGKGFADCAADQQTTLAEAAITAERSFFRLFRDRVAGGYYSTPEGWRAIGYTGNVPLAGDYPGPPPEALAHIGIA
jgi:hypothetical protein